MQQMPTRKPTWQDHFDDYCFNNLGGSDPVGSDYDRAVEYADRMVEEEDEPDAPKGNAA